MKLLHSGKKEPFVVFIVLVALVFLSSCGAVAISQQDSIIVDGRPVLSLFYITKVQTSTDARKIPNCEGEYLIKIEKSVWTKPSLDETLKALFNSELLEDTGGFTSKFIADKGISVSDLIDPIPASSTDFPKVDLKTESDRAIRAVDDLCDASRAHEQITETVRAYAGSNPFRIKLDEDVKNWECFGKADGHCAVK